MSNKYTLGYALDNYVGNCLQKEEKEGKIGSLLKRKKHPNVQKQL